MVFGVAGRKKGVFWGNLGEAMKRLMLFILR